MGGAHPGLEGAEGVLDGLAPLPHRLRVLVEPTLHRLQHMLVLPAAEAPLVAGRAQLLDRTARADVGPVVMPGEPVLLVGVAIGEMLVGRTDVGVLLGNVAEVLLAEAALRLRV